jgi:hypothetical protein
VRSFIFVACLASVGCAYRTSSITVAQPVRITHVAVSGAGASTEAISDVTSRTTHMIDHANKRAHGTPIDMSVAVNVEKPRDYLSFLHTDGIGLFFLIWPILGGMVIDRSKVDVDVVIASGNRLLHGHGSADKEGSVYAPARKRALAVALDQAVSSAR